MSRDGLLSENQTTGETERISKREQEADLQKTPEQQAAQDAAQLNPLSGDAAPATRLPGLPGKTDTGTAERVINRVDAEHTRKASKKAARKAQQEATAQAHTSRLQFTDEERATPELEKYINKSDKAADKLDAARAAIPKKKRLTKERTFDEATGKAKVRLHFEEVDKPPGGKLKHNPLSRPAQEAGLLTEIRNTYLVHRLTWGSRAPTAEQVLRIASTGGANVLGRADIGYLAAGMAADLVLFDWDQFQYAGGKNDPAACIVLSGDSKMVDTVLVNGKIVVRGGTLTTVDERETMDRVNRTGKAMLQKASVRQRLLEKDL